MLTAKDIAEYFLTLDIDEELSNLKIQKLLYYAQGIYVALHHEPLFHDKIEHWTQGPVVPELYHEYKVYGTAAILHPTIIDLDKYSPQMIEVLNEVWDVFGQYSAWRLRAMTHDDPPWCETQDNQEITIEALERYFHTMVLHG